MTQRIGIAGRQARSLARSMMGAWSTDHSSPSAVPITAQDRPPFLQEKSTGIPSEPGEHLPADAGSPMAASEIERETPLSSPEDVAERVYRIFCENLRLDLERRGAR